jgi:hypothetical protein
MKVERFKLPKSSFLSVEKDLSIIVKEMFKNPRLQKLLHYETPDALKKDDLSDEDKLALFGKNIKIVPKISVDGKCLNYVIISFDNFSPNGSNPEFRDNIIEFDVICHFDQWAMRDFQLRPYRIAAEIDSIFDGTHLTGIGTLQFLGANQIILTDEFAGLCLMYSAIHGEEDKNSYTPIEEDQIHFKKLLEEIAAEADEE